MVSPCKLHIKCVVHKGAAKFNQRQLSFSILATDHESSDTQVEFLQ